MPAISSDKKVSIIIPIYNREKTLPRLFSSLSRITFRPLEIVLVDNQSQDQSLQLCRQFQKEQTDVPYLTVLVGLEKQPGACAARNLGIQMSTGKYLYFFDSDDEISKEFLDDLMNDFPEYDMVCAPTYMCFENGKTKRRDCVPTGFPYDQILSASLSTQSFILKKDFLESIGNWDENIKRWNDWELGIRILCHTPRLKWHTEKAYHKIYQHQQSISGQSFTKDSTPLLQSLQKVEQDLMQSTLSSEIKRKSMNALCGKYLLLAANIYKEGNRELAKEIYATGMSKSNDALFKKRAALLYQLSLWKIPGMWRIFLRII